MSYDRVQKTTPLEQQNPEATEMIEFIVSRESLLLQGLLRKVPRVRPMFYGKRISALQTGDYMDVAIM